MEDTLVDTPYLTFNRWGAYGVPDHAFMGANYQTMSYPSNEIEESIQNGIPATTTLNSVLIRLQNGSVSDPSLAFYNDLGSGIYRIGSQDFGFAVNRALLMEWTNNQVNVWANTAGSQAVLTLNQAGAGDEIFRFVLDSSDSYAMGIAQSDNKKFKFNYAANANAALTASSLWEISTDGKWLIRPSNSSSTIPAWELLAQAVTNAAASTEITDFYVAINRNVQWATGNIAQNRSCIFEAPTLQFVGASTITTAATVAITNAPQAGTNATITNPFALWVQAGNVQFGTVGGGLFWDNTNKTVQLSSTVGPYLTMNPCGNGTIGEFLWKMTPTEASTKNFNVIMVEKANSTDPRNNVHWKLGYNIDKSSGTPEFISEPALYLAFEPFFQTGADRAVEAYFEYLTASATPTLMRPWYVAISRLTDTIKAVNHSSDAHYWYSSGPNPGTTLFMRLESFGLGINTPNTRRRLDVLDISGPQARFTYTDNSVYGEVTINSSGNWQFSTTGGLFCFNAAPSTGFGVLQVVNSGIYTSESACAISIRNTSTSPNKLVNIGYDNTLDAGFIYCLHAATAVKPIIFPGSSLIIGSGAIAMNATDGFLYIAGMAGIPTGTPTAFTGRYPLTWNSTDKVAELYDTFWRSISPLYAYKASDQTITNSSTLTDDSALTVNVKASRTYRFRFVIFQTSASVTAGIKLTVNGTCTATAIKFQAIDFAGTPLLGRGTSLGASVGLGVGTGDNFLEIEGAIQVNAAGTLKLQWAQNAADAVNGTTVQQNSYVELIQIG